MLPFTNEKLLLDGNHFIYDRSSKVHPIARFSYYVFNDLKNYLGIERELNEHWKMASYLKTEAGNENKISIYDMMKIERINTFYNHYIDFLLETTMILYYTVYDKSVLQAVSNKQFLGVLQAKVIEIEGKAEISNTIRQYNKDTRSMEDIIFTGAINTAINATNTGSMKQTADLITKCFRKSGLQLSTCFEKARQKCEPMYAMVKQMIEEEYPTHTFADNNTKTAKSYSTKSKK